MSEDIKATAVRLIDIWNTRELDFVDEVIDSSYEYHDPNTPDLGKGPEGYKARLKLYETAFPDMRFSVDEVLAEGDRVLLRWQASGTHTGDLQGIPATGKATSGPGMSILHFRNGKVIDDFCIWDTLGMLRQLGVPPAAAMGQAA